MKFIIVSACLFYAWFIIEMIGAIQECIDVPEEDGII